MLSNLFRVILALLIFIGASAHAQTGLPVTGTSSSGGGEDAVIAAEDMTPEAINAMVARMSDDQVRALLLERMDAEALQDEQVQTAITLVDRASALWNDFSSPMMSALNRLPTLPAKIMEIFGNFISSQGGMSGVITLFGLIGVVLAAGFAAEYLTRKFVLSSSHLDTVEDESGLRESVTLLFKRFLREIVGLIAFFIVLRALGRFLLTPEQLVFAAPLVAYMIWMPRLSAAFSRFLLAPNRADVRLVKADDRTAKFLHRHIVGLFILGGFTLFFVGFGPANGVPGSETRIGFWLDSLVYVYIAYIAWSARDGLSDMMRGNDEAPTRMEERVAVAYPYFMIAVAFSTWVLVSVLVGRNQTSQLLQGAHYFTMALLFIAPVIDTAVRALVRHGMPPMSGEGSTAEAAYQATKRSFVNIGRVISVGILILLIARAWDFEMVSLLQDGAGIADNLFGFLMTLVVGYIVYEGVSLWINMRLAAEHTALGLTGGEDEESEMGAASSSRLSTVLPLALLCARATIVVLFGLLAIGNLGIDITPLLAGAGIAGLAIGFGAQKLVTDVVSGVFFLVDDAFRTGEYVDVGGTMGAVEKISIRSMQLRHHNGPVHTIPYGEIPKLTNFSRDWVIMKLKFTVPFDTDPNKVKKIFKKIGQDLMVDPLFDGDFLQPFKSQGVADINDVGMVIRGKFMAKPGKQFMIRKEIYNKIKVAFAENGIDFARREVRVALDDGDHAHELSDADKAKVVGAAAAAAQQQDDQPAAAPKGPDG